MRRRRFDVRVPAVNLSSDKPNFDRLANAEEALRKLSALCCEPGRSPRMAALNEPLSAVRSDLDNLGMDVKTAESLMLRLEDAGAQIGSLQIGCCAQTRLPLYAQMLSDLTSIQLDANQWLGR